MTTTTDLGILTEAQELANRPREESKREQMSCGRCPLDARNPDHDCAAPDCLDDQDVPAFLRPQAG